MEKPELTFKIEMMGNLIYQLRYIQTQFEDSGLEIVDNEFDRTMEALKEMKELVLRELDEYIEHCKANNEPVYLPYWTVRKELRQAYLGD